MQLTSEVIPPSFYLFLFEEMVSILHLMSSQPDCERDVRRDSIPAAPKNIGLAIAEIHKYFKLRGSSL